MKAHVGVDSKTKIIPTAVATAANVSDVAMLPDLLHGEETQLWGDGAYQGQTEVIRECAPRARDFTWRRCRYKGQIVDEVAWAKNRTKSKVRTRVEETALPVRASDAEAGQYCHCNRAYGRSRTSLRYGEQFSAAHKQIHQRTGKESPVIMRV